MNSVIQYTIKANTQNIMKASIYEFIDRIKYNNVNKPRQLQKGSAPDLVSGLANCPGKTAQISSPRS